jgi:hypothetical protein
LLKRIKTRENEEHEEHRTQQHKSQSRQVFKQSKVRFYSQSCMDQELSIHSLRLSKNQHDVVKIGFGSKLKS